MGGVGGVSHLLIVVGVVVEADAAVVGDLRQILIIKLLQADVLGGSGGGKRSGGEGGGALCPSAPLPPLHPLRPPPTAPPLQLRGDAAPRRLCPTERGYKGILAWGGGDGGARG